MPESDHDDAWQAVHDRLADRWRVGPPTYDPGRRRWEVVAMSPKPKGRGRPPTYIIGEGSDELAALWDLANRLRPR